MRRNTPNTRVPFDYKPEPATAQRKGRLRWLFAVLMLPLLGGLLAYMPPQSLTPRNLEPAVPAIEALEELEAPEAAPLTTEAPEAATPTASEPVGDKVDVVVRRNDTLERIFRRYKLSRDDLAAMLRLPEARRGLNRIRPRDKITVVHDEGAVQALSRRLGETDILSITRTDGGFAAEFITMPIDVRTVYASGTIDSSLFVAARAAGVHPETILRLANDIFGWDIDFALDIRPGDRFNMIYEQRYREGEYLGDGRILAAEFVNDGEVYRAIHYTSDDGRIADYFTPEGRSMRRQFLRAPLDFRRVSSNFNPRRRHPILNRIRAHRGVDYAAPTGTVIKAAGDGRVDFIGIKGGYGRVIILEHGGEISTLYGHMSRFARLRHGQRVKQGQTIGYVGRSGAATGPHLHYEYRINGIHKNPRTVRLPDAAPLPAEYLADFRVKTGVLLANLELAHARAVAAAQAAN